MEKLINDNDIERFNLNLTLDNDIDNKDRRVESIARQLVSKFGSDKSYEFYCKVSYKLSESQIWTNYEKAQRGKNPGGLFNYLCRKDMQ